MRCLVQALRIAPRLVQALQLRYNTVSLTAFRKKDLRTFLLNSFFLGKKGLGNISYSLQAPDFKAFERFLLKQLFFRKEVFSFA